MHRRTSSKTVPTLSTAASPQMRSPYSPNANSPQSSSVSLLGPQSRGNTNFQAAHMQPPSPGRGPKGFMPLGSSHRNSDISFSSKYSLAPDPSKWGAALDMSHPEPDDDLHNPDPNRDRRHDSGGTIFTARGVANLGCLAILLLGLIGLFAGYPMAVSLLERQPTTLGGYNLGGINATGQVPDMPGNFGLIDKDTPAEAYTHISVDDGSEWDLVFSDEFNTEGRTFYPGDDPYWEAVDLHYWGTNNLEWYSPDMVTTSNGFLNVTLDRTPWRGLDYKGGLIMSWNKFCFTGGYFVANVSLPGKSTVYGLWPAVWAMGNLGRAGYGASLDGMWPYTYDACDVGTLANQTFPDGTPVNATRDGDPSNGGVLSFLPGQRLSACTCPNESHPGPKRADGSFVGRAAPEIDILEAQVDSGTLIGHVSMSGQWAPYNYGYEWFNTTDNIKIMQEGTILNSYHGGVYQQTTSGLATTNQECYTQGGGCFAVYGFEYKPGYDGYITWVNDNEPAWTIRGAGMGPDPRVEISGRPVPQEPMYMIINLGISPNFGAIDFEHLQFPTWMLVDWVRVYQPKDAHNIGCDPPDFPTSDYINTYIEASHLCALPYTLPLIPRQRPTMETLPPVQTTLSSAAPTIAEKPEADDAKTIAPEVPTLSQLRPLQKNVLLAIFCLGQFLDVMNTSAMLPALPATSQTVGLTESDSVWLFAAYQATFASFLLISGRISDIYGPKPAFILGSLFFGATSLGAGFLSNRIALLVLRALQGIGAAHTIPSALSMIVQMMPEPREQQRAIGLFGASGAIANVLGTIIGALLVEYASWRWIFWLISIVSIPAATACIALIPATPRRKGAKASQLDALGVSILIAAIVLFVYALTTGSVSGWRSGGVLAPFFVSIALFVAFFFWETRVEEANAALPPKLWFYPNFAVLFGTALMPFFWYMQMYLTFSPYWQDYLHWSTIIAGVKFLPLGVVAGPLMVNGGRIAAIGRPKLLIMGGLTLAFIATILLPFSSRLSDRYWPLVFPAFIIGSAGTAVVFVLANISIFQTTPPEYAGTVGAVFNSALQLGGAIGTSATTSIQASIDERVLANGTFDGTHFQGRAASLWFLLAWVGIVAIGVGIFYRQDKMAANDVEGKAEADRPVPMH